MCFEVEIVLLRALAAKRNAGKGTPAKAPAYKAAPQGAAFSVHQNIPLILPSIPTIYPSISRLVLASSPSKYATQIIWIEQIT